MKLTFHVRFGSGGGVGDCPADHNLGCKPVPVLYRVAKAAQRAERSKVLNEGKKVAISEQFDGFSYLICG